MKTPLCLLAALLSPLLACESHDGRRVPERAAAARQVSPEKAERTGRVHKPAAPADKPREPRPPRPEYLFL